MSTLPTPKEYMRSEGQGFAGRGFAAGERGLAADQMVGARANVVNRTHRVVRERAMMMRAQKSRSRSLWVPMIIFSSLMIVIVYAVWGVLDGYDLTPNGVPDASDQMMLLLLWSLPVTVVVLGLIWLKRARSGNGEVQQ